MKALLVVLPILLLSSCVQHVPLGQPVKSAPGEPGFTYVKLGEVYQLLVANDAGYRAGLASICGKHVCSVEVVGDLYLVKVQP